MKAPLVMECAWCRGFFEAKRQHAKTCSPKCRQAWVRGLRRAREEAEAEYHRRRADVGTQLTIPGTVEPYGVEPTPIPVPVPTATPPTDAEPVPTSAPLGSITPGSVTVPEPVPSVPTALPVVTSAAVRAALRAAQSAPGGKGPEMLSGALGEAIRRITQTGTRNAT